MDSVLSSGQKEQAVVTNGRIAPESVVSDKDDELEDSHQRLLFGGTSPAAAEPTADAGLISAAARMGGSVQRARDTSTELNLVNISGITATTTRSDARPTAAATTYDSNPLPAMAKTGVASTIGLQSPSSDNAVPSGRRSGATDKISVQLTADSTPVPMISADIKLSQLDPVAKHNLATASVNGLFDRLGTTVPAGSRDINTVSAVSSATVRRSAEPIVEKLPEITIPSANISSTSRPVAEGKQFVDTRPVADGKQDQQILPLARPTGDKGLISGATALPEALGTTYGARTRTAIEPQVNPDLPPFGAKARPIVEPAITLDSSPGQRVNSKTVIDGLGTVVANNDLTPGARSRSVNANNGSPDNIPAPAKNNTRAINDNTGGLISGVQSGIETSAPLPPFRKAPGDHVTIPSEINPNATRGVPVAGSFNPYAGSQTPQVLPEITAPKLPRAHNDQPNDIYSPPSTRSGESIRGGLPLPAVFGDKSQPILVGDGGSPRREVPASPQTTIGKDGQIFIPAARPSNDVINNNQLPSVPRTDSTSVRPGDPPKGPLIDLGTSMGTTINRTINGATEIIVQPARNHDNGLPRTDSILPVDKQGRPLEPGQTTERGAVKAADGVAAVGANLPTNLIRNGEPAIASDKGPARTADGRAAEPGRVVEPIARATDPSRPGESVSRPGESIARNGESVARNGESIARNGESVARTGESVARNGESVARNGETIARNSETAVRGGEIARTADGAVKVGGESLIRKEDVVVKTGESTVKTSEGITKASENIAKVSEGSMKVADAGAKIVEGSKVTEVAARIIEAQVKATGDVASVSGKPVEVAAKAGSEAVSGQKVQDVAARLGSDAIVKTTDAVVRGNDQSAIVRAQDVVVNSQMASADKNIKLSDAIVKSADQAVKAPDVNQPVKMDGIARVTEQSIPAIQNNQNANPFIAAKNDIVRNEANAGTKVGEQNQIVAQNQLGMQNQIAQNQNAAMNGRANEQVVAQGVKSAGDFPVPGQRNPNANIADVKVDQVVADILNDVRHNAKDQQAGAKILSSLDQGNIAANQQLDPRVLLDAAAVRRILDGQGISLNPATLNTIMEGIRPTGEHAVDYALPSIGSLNLSQIISLGERLQEAVAGAGNETSEPLSKPQLQQHRTKYLVKEGDTLESIAQEKLGDARLVQLLITINRAQVNYRLEGERKVAYVVPNQYLWLPTDHELDVHKKNFFGKHGKDGSIALNINSKQNTPLIPPVSFDRTREVSAEISASMEDFRPASGSSNASNPLSGNRMSAGYEVKKYVPSLGSASGSRSGSISGSESDASKMAGNLDKVRHAGNRKSVNLDEFEYVSTQVSHRQCYQVREGETLMSIAASLESMGHISMWKLLAKINGFQIEAGGIGKSIDNLFAGQFIVLPTTDELNEYKLLEKLTSCTNSATKLESAANNAFSCVQEKKHIETPPPPALVALAQGVGGLTTVHKLSAYTRLVLNDLPHLENCFSITVEARWNGQWKPMASYECRHGQTTRHLYSKHGEIKSMELDLPSYVVKEMAREDFIRNWNEYVNCFMGEAAERFV